jgi:hypothetical protein
LSTRSKVIKGCADIDAPAHNKSTSKVTIQTMFDLVEQKGIFGKQYVISVNQTLPSISSMAIV